MSVYPAVILILVTVSITPLSTTNTYRVITISLTTARESSKRAPEFPGLFFFALVEDLEQKRLKFVRDFSTYVLTPNQLMEFITPEVSLYYEFTAGEGTPITFIHGALGTCEQMRPLLPVFEGRPTLLLDLPSHGRSTTTNDQVTTSWFASLLLSLLDKLHIESADVIGYSLGGYVGLEAAKLDRKRIRSVISHAMKFYWTNEAIHSSVSELHGDTIKAKSQKAYDALAQAHHANGLERTLELSRALIAHFHTAQLSVDDIKHLQLPLLLSVGDRDELVSLPEILDLYQSLDPAFTSLTILPNTRHPFHFLPKDTFKEAVDQFWNAHKLQ